ncbi:MAG: serine hydrolase, partial [Bdellovibrionales bacterium]|nr:serine hydrolase [Bdellovibrionales bacterium]
GADGYSMAQLTDCFKSGGCAFKGTANYGYSNLGIGMLSIALQGQYRFQNYDQLLRSKFTQTLGLSNTATKDSEQYSRLKPGTAPASVAFGYLQGPKIQRPGQPRMAQLWDQKVAESKIRQPFSGMGVLAGAGGAITNARDMVRLLKVLTGVDRAVMTPAIELASRSLRRGSEIAGSQTNRREIGYAIDEFDMKQYRGISDCSQNLQSVIVKAKGGSTRSHVANIAWVPEKELGLVIMVNRAGFESKINCLSLNLLNQLLDSN